LTYCEIRNVKLTPQLVPGFQTYAGTLQTSRPTLLPFEGPRGSEMMTSLSQATSQDEIILIRLEDLPPAALHGLLTSGVYQFQSYPVTRFQNAPLPRGSRVRYGDLNRLLQGRMQSRLMTVYQPGTNKYYAWDFHNPVGNRPHDVFHINQKGMYSQFGQANHAPMTAQQIRQAQKLQYLKIGGRAFLVAGVMMDSYYMAEAIEQSVEEGSLDPVTAQSIRTAGGWGSAWAGAGAGAALGGALGIETGPGAVIFAIGGALVLGTAGYFGADWVADMIHEN
jgi:hypothetical protein